MLDTEHTKESLMSIINGISKRYLNELAHDEKWTTY
mgnify:CR=1 FL=1